MTGPVLRFDRFELQPAQRRLLRDGVEVPLRSRAFDLLVALASRAGDLVTKDELLDVVWPGVVVEENNIAAQVAALRKALRSDIIVTIPGRGYRLEDKTSGSTGAGKSDSADASHVANDVPRPLSAAAPDAKALFGRESDLSRLGHALAASGCVTLVGPGGVGKTSLAQVLRSSTPSPTFWVDLAPLSAADQLLPALSRGVGLSIEGGDMLATVGQALAGAQLLVLDNAEHLADATAELVLALRREVPLLKLLITSQTPLAIAGERIERIDPLELPAPEMPDDQARTVGALAMFVDRIRAADSRYQVTSASMPLLRRLCAELDGLPLALEMAAARVPLLGLQKVSQALEERFSALRLAQRNLPHRHRSLQALLDWSYQLLAPEEQRLFRALGVFSSVGFTLELAVAVVADEDRWETIDRIALLIDRSLVAVDHADPPRYRLLETMRSYALARLREADEETLARTRQGAAVQSLFASVHDLPRDPSHETRREQVMDEMENAREILAWARRNDHALATRLSAYVVSQASLLPWRAEAFSWLASCEPLLEGEAMIEPRWRAMWWRYFAAQTLLFAGPLATQRARRAIEVCREAGEPLHLAYSLIYFAFSLSEPGPAVDAALNEAQTLIEAHPDWLIELRVLLLNAKARARVNEGDLDTPTALLADAFDLAVPARLHTATRFTAITLADVLHRTGRAEEALALLEWGLRVIDAPEGLVAQRCRLMQLRLKFELGRFDEALVDAVAAVETCWRFAMPAVYGILALGVAQARRPRTAALLVGRSRQATAEHGVSPREAPESDLKRAAAMALETLDAAAFADLVERGRSIDDGELQHLLQSGDSAVGSTATLADAAKLKT